MEVAMNKFKGMTSSEKKIFLEDFYLAKRLTIRQIAKLCNVTGEAIHYWIKKFDMNKTKFVSIILILWGLILLQKGGITY